MRSVLLALLIGLTSDVVSAQERIWYLAGDIGWTGADLISRGGDPLFFQPGSYDLTSEESVHFRLGRRLDKQWRVELETARRVSDFRGFCFDDGECSRASEVSQAFGELERATLFGNVIYDLPLTVGRLRPFVGIGAGGADLVHDRPGGGRDRTWAWQGFGGVSIWVTDSWSLDATYRLIRIEDIETHGLRTGAGAQCGPPPGVCVPPTLPTGVNLSPGPGGDAVATDNVVSVGFRYRFGGAD